MTSVRIEALLSQFRHYGIHRNGTDYFCRRTAIEIIDKCELFGIRILGIDGYYLTARSTEQPIEWILDLSRKETEASCYEVARRFVEQAAALPLFYEFVFDDPLATNG